MSADITDQNMLDSWHIWNKGTLSES